MTVKNIKEEEKKCLIGAGKISRSKWGRERG